MLRRITDRFDHGIPAHSDINAALENVLLFHVGIFGQVDFFFTKRPVKNAFDLFAREFLDFLDFERSAIRQLYGDGITARFNESNFRVDRHWQPFAIVGCQMCVVFLE